MEEPRACSFLNRQSLSQYRKQNAAFVLGAILEEIVFDGIILFVKQELLFFSS